MHRQLIRQPPSSLRTLLKWAFYSTGYLQTGSFYGRESHNQTITMDFGVPAAATAQNAFVFEAGDICIRVTYTNERFAGKVCLHALIHVSPVWK